MTMDPGEKAKLDAEWNKMQGFGKRLARQKAIATIAGCAVMAAVVIPCILFGNIILWLLAFPLGALAGWPVRNKLWPKGQFS